ncbi:germin-like protein 9-3 [Mangifera indica]|uniref:germin-like protein 9-3 n=1 Tax=Mangifera indica TaxID=29780 RepID=UPI001CF9CD63|nr:germin-like protein 9-3 [Mangifera indica]
MTSLKFHPTSDILTDSIVPANSSGNAIGGSFFAFTGMRKSFYEFPPNFTVTKATVKEFPALDGQSVSYALIKYPAASINPPHTHPRSAELLFVVDGILNVGFVDNTNKLYTQTLQLGDIFVFPKGMVHYQSNDDPKKPAAAIAAFCSANAGTVSVPLSVFATGIDDVVLAKAFKTDVATIKKLKAGLAWQA